MYKAIKKLILGHQPCEKHNILTSNAGFALPVAIIAKCKEKIFLAQKNVIWRKQMAKKNLKKKSPSKYYRLWLFIAMISHFYKFINHQLKHSCTCQKVNP